MSKKIAIWGWWQGNNLGDNWIRNTLQKFFPDADFVPTSVKKFENYDFVICGGGGLFIFDVEYPFNQVNIGVPYGIVGMGAEFEHSSRIAIKVKRKADFFFARDQYSVKCMHLSKKCRSYDVTFLNPLPYTSYGKVNVNKVFFVWRDGHEWLENNKFAEYISYEDTEKEWKKCIGSNFEIIEYNDFQTQEWSVLDTLNDCGFVISGRYHGIVAAIQRGLPFIAIDICPKIRALTEECGLDEYCLKISEVEKVEDVIKKAKENVDLIRMKEKEFTEQASAKLIDQMHYIKKRICKRLYPKLILKRAGIVEEARKYSGKFKVRGWKMR